jgi:copper(I)-binding protein
VSRSTRRVASVAFAALFVGATASGCAAGFNATTNQPYAPSNGSVTTIGDLRVTNVVIVQSTDGGLSELYASFINNGTSPDALVAVSLAGLGTVALPDGPITIPANTKVDLGPDGTRLFIDNLKLIAGDVTTVTFRFAGAGDTHLNALIMTEQGLVSGG